MNSELERLKGEAHAGESTVYIVTTGRGRKKKAHILDSEEGGSLCGRCGNGVKRLDSATVNKFYDKCGYCQSLNE